MRRKANTLRAWESFSIMVKALSGEIAVSCVLEAKSLFIPHKVKSLSRKRMLDLILRLRFKSLSKIS